MPSISENRALAQSQVPLMTVVAKQVELHAEGANVRGACPLHPDNGRGLYVAQNGRFHCFSCGAGGDVVDWTMLLDGVDETTAVQRLLGRQPPASNGSPATNS